MSGVFRGTLGGTPALIFCRPDMSWLGSLLPWSESRDEERQRGAFGALWVACGSHGVFWLHANSTQPFTTAPIQACWAPVQRRTLAASFDFCALLLNVSFCGIVLSRLKTGVPACLDSQSSPLSRACLRSPSCAVSKCTASA